jgi:hypothetical protein
MKQTSVTPYPRILEELDAKRDHHGGIVSEELRKDPPDYGVVNPNQQLTTLFHQAGHTIRLLAAQNEKMADVLVNRVLVALDSARAPEWKPTHRHYKGKEYRVTGIRYDAEFEELVEKVEYDDRDGMKFVLTRQRFESKLPSGAARYEYIFVDDPTKAH